MKTTTKGKTSCLLRALVACALGCASTKTPKVDPYETSAAGHEAEAAKEEAAAAVHTAHYNPYARSGCTDTTLPPGVPCWTSIGNPTSQELADAQAHHDHAAAHRAASKALREAEARACQGVAEPDRDMSPLHRRGDILAIEPLSGGITIVLRKVPGLSTASLQRIVDCHLARNAALGYDRPCNIASPDRFCEASSPLSVREVSAEVISVGDRFAVRFVDQSGIAQKLVERGQALVERDAVSR